MVARLVEVIVLTAAFTELFTICIYIYFYKKRRREEEAQQLPETPQSPRPSPAAVMAASVAIMLLDYVSFRRQHVGASASAGGGSVDDCAVCLGALEDGEVCCVLPMCRHEFHRECMEKWLKTNKSTCPVCRAKVQLPCVLQRLPVADMV